MKCNVDYYFVEPQPDDVNINTVHFDITNSYQIDPKYPTFNILLTKAEKGMLHAASITDVEELVGYRVCPYCKQQVYNLRADPQRKNQPKFNMHVDECKKNSGLF